MNTIDTYRYRAGKMVKVYSIKAFSQECNPQFLSASKHNNESNQYCYFIVKKDQFDKLSEKPILRIVCRPIQFDKDIKEVLHYELNGPGWVEEFTDKNNCHHINTYIII